MKKLFALFIAALLFFYPHPVYAHAFGQLYTLPVPFSLYALGAGAAVIVSFLIVGFFFRDTREKTHYPTYPLAQVNIVTLLQNESFIRGVQVISIALFLLTIITGLFGTQEETANFNMTFFWIIAVLGMTYATGLFGNIYSVLNPWKILISVIERLRKDFAQGLVSYPKQFAYYPALIFYFLFIWFELFGDVSPYELSILLILYTFINFLGALVFGKNNWFAYGEFFNVFYIVLSNISLFVWKENKLFIRPLFSGLLSAKAEQFSLVLFILFMLASTAFDGFRETIVWWNIYILSFIKFSKVLGDAAVPVVGAIGLILSLLFFLLLYFILLLVMKVIIRSKLSIMKLATYFIFSLVPIVLVYNIAHYYTLLLIQGQTIIALISDPFGTGLNLFGTANLIANKTLFPMDWIWNTEVGFILLGHIVAVYLAHILSLKIFPSHKKAVISQCPMLILMVIYTVTGLWILSQPLTSGFR